MQLCIVHLVRYSLNYVGWKQRKEVARDLKTIYTSATEAEAEMRLAEFAAKWGEDLYETYPGGSVKDQDRAGIGEFRIVRGGGWANIPCYMRSTYRGRNSPTDRSDVNGFHVAARLRRGLVYRCDSAANAAARPYQIPANSARDLHLVG